MPTTSTGLPSVLLAEIQTRSRKAPSLLQIVRTEIKMTQTEVWRTRTAV